MPLPSFTDIAIVGAGLTGLALAHVLQRSGRSVTLLEARDRTGGRVYSPKAVNGHRYDLGPAWIWPHNARMLALAKRLDLTLFPQNATGRLVFEDAQGTVRRDLDFATMGGALRFADGAQSLTDALTHALLPDSLHLSTPVTRLEQSATEITLSLGGGKTLGAAQVVLALPPRLAAQLAFDPDLPAPLLRQMATTPTWMAGQGKVLATFDTPFWRDARLSGDAISHHGPLIEIHDASATEDGTGAALFGFIGPKAPRDHDTLRSIASAQFLRLFGSHAVPGDLIIQDWARAPATSTKADQDPLAVHPQYQALSVAEGPWAGRLLLSGSETAPAHGGFLEGALEAAETTAAQLRDTSLTS